MFSPARCPIRDFALIPNNIRLMLSKFGVDGHAFAGVTGCVATVMASSLSVWAGAAAGSATAIYMILRACREYVKLKHDVRAEKKYEQSSD
jgi:hypothetical protein